MELDAIDRLAAEAFDGFIVRKDLVQRFKGQYPVPTYVAEFLLGRYCASVDEEEINAEQVAEYLDIAPERIFKTLIARGDRTGPMLVLAPAGTEVDLRMLARHSGDKRVEMVPQREVFELTGYVRGAVTPLGIPRSYPVYIEETAVLWESIGISAGARGWN